MSDRQSNGNIHAEAEIIMNTAAELALKEDALAKKREKIDEIITEKILRDNSPAAKARRRNAMLRAAYGEFMCTLIFLTVIFCAITNAKQSGFDSGITALIAAFVSGLQAIAMCFAFSSVSGAHFNPSVSFALWLTGKLSNRKCVCYIVVQMLASLIAGLITKGIFFDSDISACAVIPSTGDKHLDKVFATEFFLTFILVYVAFTIVFEDAEAQKKENMSIKTIADTRGLTVYATNPQSKTGFAPFAIGFTVFSLCLCGGTSGGAFNQARMFGPALLESKWDYFYIYWIAQLCGAATAALIVHNLHRVGLKRQHTNETGVETSAAAITKLNTTSAVTATMQELPGLNLKVNDPTNPLHTSA